MEIMKMITDVMREKRVDNLHIEFWEPNGVDDGDHIVRITMEKEYF